MVWIDSLLILGGPALRTCGASLFKRHEAKIVNASLTNPIPSQDFVFAISSY